MKIPQYILSNPKTHVLGEHQALISGVQFVQNGEEHQFLISKEIKEEFNVVVSSDTKSAISFVFEADVMCKVNVIYYYTKKTVHQIFFDLHKNANVLLNETVVSNQSLYSETSRVFKLDKGSVLNIHYGNIASGRHSVKEDFFLIDRFAEMSYDTLYLGSSVDSFEVTQNIRHQAKNSISNVHNTLVSSKNAELVLLVNGYIEKGQSLSVCKQQNRGVILNAEGSVRVDPKLMIDEYDVEAGHGAAIGQINEDEMFYLLSRGLDEKDAKRLILSGYMDHYLSSLGDSAFKKTIQRKIAGKIKGE